MSTAQVSWTRFLFVLLVQGVPATQVANPMDDDTEMIQLGSVKLEEPAQFPISINFQDTNTSVPIGWLADYALTYNDRGNGYFYGWYCGPPTTETRNRNNSNYSDLENTLVVPDRLNNCSEEHWDIAVPNGMYTVQVILQDTQAGSRTATCTLEGSSLGLPYNITNFSPIGAANTATLTVNVTDGNLTFAGSMYEECNGVNRLVIHQAGTYDEMTGGCRTEDNTPGTHTDVEGKTQAECQSLCTVASTCVAYEIWPSGRCELHTEAITHAVVSQPGQMCYAKTLDVTSATGDPHLSNVRGEHFDIYQPGKMALVHLPRRAELARTLLLVEAEARSMGDVCSVYFQVVSISGLWTNQSKPIQFFAKPHGNPEGRNWKNWMRFGPIDLKVSLRKKGVDYLNVYARNVGRSGYEVGGLLGLDDHAAVAERPRQCALRHAAALWSSVAHAI